VRRPRIKERRRYIVTHASGVAMMSEIISRSSRIRSSGEALSVVLLDDVAKATPSISSFLARGSSSSVGGGGSVPVPWPMIIVLDGGAGEFGGVAGLAVIVAWCGGSVGVVGSSGFLNASSLRATGSSELTSGVSVICVVSIRS
jgi:hypothetical protein